MMNCNRSPAEVAIVVSSRWPKMRLAEDALGVQILVAIWWVLK